MDAAKAAFKKKFKDKSANDWEKRTAFAPKKGKYTLIEMDHSGDAVKKEPAKLTGKAHKCTLQPAVKETIELIFSHDMSAAAAWGSKLLAMEDRLVWHRLATLLVVGSRTP